MGLDWLLLASFFPESPSSLHLAEEEWSHSLSDPVFPPSLGSQRLLNVILHHTNQSLNCLVKR
jgi:hypothetical protein